MDSKLIPQEAIKSKILFLRGKKVMIYRDLAILYEVPTKALNQAVKRNIHRFPEHFMFQLTSGGKDKLVTNCDRFKPLKYSTTLPYAFTELSTFHPAFPRKRESRERLTDHCFYWDQEKNCFNSDF